uniref:Uncharacterized protein n=1 Tax=Lactuca sativa TaxID=4236 RepID=A0A9R1W927_LACSA|nr:hypothetical protein LSAT_V11C300133570 [Lactuca sativa]
MVKPLPTESGILGLMLNWDYSIINGEEDPHMPSGATTSVRVNIGLLCMTLLILVKSLLPHLDPARHTDGNALPPAIGHNNHFNHYNHYCSIISSLVVASGSGSGTSTSVSTIVVPAPKLPSEITKKTVEEIIKEWNVELQILTSLYNVRKKKLSKYTKMNMDYFLMMKQLQPEMQMYEQAEFIEREMKQMTEQIKSVIQNLIVNHVIYLYYFFYLAMQDVALKSNKND